MVYNILYTDGSTTVHARFENEEAFRIWKSTMDGMRDIASLIDNHFHHSNHPTIQHRNAIRSWLEVFQEIEDADAVILPSVINLRDNYLLLLLD
jgi:hypothetical protein